jgi:EmrB/QacA subfamily drug resistance transporter
MAGEQRETRQPADAYVLSRGRTLLVLTGVTLAIFVASVSHLMLLTAVPKIVGDLGGIDRYSWIISAYFLASTITVALWGKLSDMYGRRRFMLLAIACFMVGNIVCGFAPSMNVLIVGRMLQGAGAGGIVPIGMAAIADIMAPRQRGKWQAYLGTATAVSATIGPALGGWITQSASWRWVFFAGLPVGFVALATIWFAFSMEPPKREHSLDYVGAALLGSGLTCGLLALSWGGQQYAWTSPVVIGLFTACTVLLAGFGRWEQHVPEPIVPLALFRNRTFAAAQVALFCLGASYWTAQVFTPLFAQGALGEGAAASGAILTPFVIATTAAGILSGQFVSRTGRYRPPLIACPIVLGVGFVLLTRVGPQTSRTDLVRDLLIAGAGFGLGTSLLGVVVQNAVPKQLMGVASAANQFSRVVGGTIVITLLGALFSTRLHARLVELVPGTPAAHLSQQELVSSHSLSKALTGPVHIAFGSATSLVFITLVPFVALAFLAICFIERRPLRASLGGAPASDDAAAPAATGLTVGTSR